MIVERARREYLENGCCLLPGVLSPAEMTRILDVVAQLVAHAPREGEGVQPFLAPDGTQVVKYDGGFYVEYLTRHVAALASLLAESAIPGLVRELLAADEVMFWRDEIHLKAPGKTDNATPWHHGVGSFPFKGGDALTVWIPLTPVGRDDGPLRTVRGSHRDQTVRYRPPTRPALDGAGAELYAAIPDFDELAARGEAQIVTWEMAPGDALAFHPYAVHGSLPNVAGRQRVAYASRWLGPDARYEPDCYSVLEPGVDEDQLLNGKPVSPLFPIFARQTSASAVPSGA